jgi:hypothetical protein
MKARIRLWGATTVGWQNMACFPPYVTVKQRSAARTNGQSNGNYSSTDESR